MRVAAWLAGASVFATCVAASASSTAQAHLPRTLSVGGTALELVSCGVRDSLWIDHYAAGLYIAPARGITSVMDPQAPKAVRLKMISVRFIPETIPEKWLVALQSALPAEPLGRLRKAYRSLSDGDVMTISYGPASGVVVQVNGRRITQVPQHRVIDAILSAWAEEKTVESKLKTLSEEKAC